MPVGRRGGVGSVLKTASVESLADADSVPVPEVGVVIDDIDFLSESIGFGLFIQPVNNIATTGAVTANNALHP